MPTTGQLDDSPADVIRQLLIRLGLATDPDDKDAWPAYAHNEPNLPDNCLTCYNVDSTVYYKTSPDMEVQEYHNVVIRCRGQTDSTAYTKLNHVAATLDKVQFASVEISPACYSIPGISRSGVRRLGKDAPNSSRYIYNLDVSCPLTQTL